MKKLFVLLLMIVIASCSENKSDKKPKEKTTELVKEENAKIKNLDQVSIVIEAKVLVDDVFEIYYYETGYDSFTSKDFVSTRVEGDEKTQKIKFLLPKRVYPERLRLDFGKNQNQNEIILEGVKLNYKEKEYRFSREELKSLKPSKYLEYNSQTMTIKPKAIGDKYDPYFYTIKLTSILDYLIEED